jgi:predicted metal-dependent phosphoesterase TrpH
MIIDMHVHTKASLDSPATAEDYCKAIKRFRRHHPFDGFVLTEHRFYDKGDRYEQISDKYEILIFRGIEVDTDLGHLLVYGVTKNFLKRIDVSLLRIKARDVIRVIGDYGGIAVPSHPYRESSYGDTLENNADELSGLSAIETYNGSNTQMENDKASKLATQKGLYGIGGSDAHYVNAHWFLTCATEFDNPIHTDEDLVRELKKGHYGPIILDNSGMKRF